MYEEQVIKTFYLSNLTQATELNELVQTLRTLLELTRITPNTSQNAIIIRDTPDKVAVAEKIIQDIDRAKPEVVIQVAVLQARRDRARELGILPSTSVPLIFTPRSSVGPETGGDGTTGAIRLDELGRLAGSDYSLILPSATAMALLTESTTKVLQNPQVRVTDGQTAKLRIGDRVPFAVGSFQPGIGGVGINPLVNTQFQFQHVGVNLDITPRVHPNREISLHVIVEVSSVTGRVSIGGIEQPIFGQRKLEHDIRLREGEVSILGGIVERTEVVSLEGWPGLAKVPFLGYLFGSKRKESQESEILIVLTPRIVRIPEISALNLRPLAIGTGQAITLRHQAAAPPSTPPSAAPRSSAAQPEPKPPQAPPLEPGVAQLRFEPAQARVGIGQQVAVNLVIERVRDLFTVPFALSYNPQVVELAEVHHGGFLGGDEYPAALVHRVDAESGAAIISLSRPPGTSGASGQGVLVTLVFRGLAPGQTVLSISRIAARASNRERLEVETHSGAIVVEQNTGQLDPRVESNPRAESPTP
jgi:general secretion pathway protein D